MASQSAPPPTAEALAMFPQLVTPHMYGILIGSVLSGFVFQQILTYYTGPRGKGRVERITTFSMSVACVALLGIDWWNIHEFSIHHAGDPMYQMIYHPADFLTVPLCVTAMFSSQAWFIERAWKVTNRSRIFLLIAGSIAFLELTCGVVIAVLGFSTVGRPEFYIPMMNMVVVALWSGAVVDLMVTAVLVYKARKTKWFAPSSSKLINPLQEAVRMSFATGLLTSITSLAAGAVYLVTMRYSNAFIPFIEAIPRLAVYSAFITINSRRKWQAALGGERSEPTPAFPPPFVVGFPAAGPGRGTSIRTNKDDKSPELDEYNLDTSAFDRDPSFFDRSSIASSRIASTPRWTAGLAGHVSEIGTEGDLDRALRDYPRTAFEDKGLAPCVESVESSPVVPSAPFVRKKTSFSTRHQRQRSSLAGSGGSGVVVARTVTTEVEE